MYRIVSFIALLLLLAVLVPRASRAQDADTLRSADPALPDIAPREVEIRGELELTLPSLSRQPIRELAPPPPSVDVAASRRPSAQPRPQPPVELAERDLEVDLPEQEAPASPVFSASHILLKASAGRYLDRYLQGRATLPLSNRETAQAQFNYEGTSGHTPFEEEPDARSTASTLDGKLALESRRLSMITRLKARGFHSSYALYGARIGVGTPSLNQYPTRQGTGATGMLSFSTAEDAPFTGSAGVQYAGTRYLTDVFDEQRRNDPFTEERVENRLTGHVNLTLPIRQVTTYLNGDMARADLDTDEGVRVSELAAGARFGLGQTVTVQLGGRLMGFSATRPSGEVSTLEVAHEFALEAALSPSVHLFLRNHPDLTQHPLAALFQQNPYLVNEPLQQPSIKTINTELGARFLWGPVQMRLHGGFQNYPSFLFFEQAERETSYGYERGFITANYEAAQVFQASTELSFMLVDRLHATVEATLRNGLLQDEETAIPYFAPATGQLSLSYAFADQKGFAELTGSYRAARPLSRSSDEEVPAFLDLDLEGTYRLTSLIDMLLRIQNLSPAGSLQAWHPYPRPPFVITAGVQWQY